MTTKETDAIRAMIRKRISSRHTYAPDSLPHEAETKRRELTIRRQWEALESAGLVRMRFVPDDCCDIADLEGDTYDIDAHADTVPGGARTIIAQRKAFEATIEREGVWGCVTDYRLAPCAECWDADYGLGVVNCSHECHNGEHPGWESGDSCWGFVGADAHCYATGLMQGAIDALRDALVSRCPVCRVPRGGGR